jgi:lipopolysaccharide/colanic/teichoic acid biosynthesis glycosyltransferase
VTTFPVLLDTPLAFLGAAPAARSLLLLPFGARRLGAELVESAAAVTSAGAVVLPGFATDSEYELRVRAAFPSVDDVLSEDRFASWLDRLDPSDALLVVSASHYPADGLDLRALAAMPTGDARMVRHLLAFESTSFHTKELVQSGDDGRVRRIQRYYEPVTWPFPAAVVASLVPVACLQTLPSRSMSSPADLRRALSGRGTASLDVPLHGHFFDLSDEAGALAFCERRVLELGANRSARRGQARGAGSAMIAASATVHETARVLGPVVALDDVVIEAGALVIGPTLLAAGTRVREGAVVAQCLVAPDATVSAGATVRHRVVAARAAAPIQPTLHRLTPSGSTVVGAPSDGRAQRRQLATPQSVPRFVPNRVASYQRVKAIVEPVLALLFLILLAPVLAVVMVLVKTTSEGPVFYGDLREGRDGRLFRCWKFRSMRTNADVQQRKLAALQQMDGPQFKMDRDPRVTAVGNVLRKLNVDELPQLFNVVRGQMSFVGPRPSPFRENQICVPWRHARLSVRPGITGLWQVCRHDRANGDFHQWIQYDLAYVQHASLAVDVRILVATILTGGGRRAVSLDRILGTSVHRASASSDVRRRHRPRRRSTELTPA